MSIEKQVEELQSTLNQLYSHINGDLMERLAPILGPDTEGLSDVEVAGEADISPLRNQLQQVTRFAQSISADLGRITRRIEL